MPQVIAFSELTDPRLHDFTSLTDVELRRRREPAEGLYIAESLKVISRALAAGHTPRSVVCTPEWLPGIEKLMSKANDIPIFVGSPQLVEKLTGYHVHRGALASFSRPQQPDISTLAENSSVLVILEGIMDHTNVGAIFRSVVALGADSVLVTEDCADPLYRRSVRVSMGAVLEVPWARARNWHDTQHILHAHGFHIAAFALNEKAETLAEFASKPRKKLALVFGSEGSGLSHLALTHADSVVCIPMQNGVDSLNVSVAAAVALYRVNEKTSQS